MALLRLTEYQILPSISNLSHYSIHIKVIFTGEKICHIRPSKHDTSKYDPEVDKVNLVYATPKYALVGLPYKRETTVLLKDVAPCTSVNSDDITDIDIANEE